MVCQKYLQILCVILVTGLVRGQSTTEPGTSAGVTSPTADTTAAAPTADTTAAAPIADTTAAPIADTTTETAVNPTTADLPADPTTAAPSELPTTGIILTCTPTQMIVEIPTILLTGGMTGDDVYFENEPSVNNSDCWGEIKNNGDVDELIELATDLTACGTAMEESNNTETYTNKVVNRDEGGISRQYVINIPLTCTYNRNERVESVSYKLTDYTIDKTLDEDGAYTFSFDIYTDSGYGTPVPSYPVNVGLNKELFFAAYVDSLDGTLDLSIRSCRATSNTEYDSEPKIEFILNGCPVDANAEIRDLEDDSRVEVMLKTLRFVEGVSDLVYIHCNLLVCEADDDSVCNKECSSGDPAIMERKRRDVSSELKTKRFTRGPLRVVRSAQRQDSVLHMDVSENGAATQQEVKNAFNPWIVAMAAMATVVMALAAIVAVVLRKVNKISAAPGWYKEGSARLLDEQEEI